jgi:hypothetical protein
MMLRMAVRSAMIGSDRIGLCVPGPSGIHILADRSVGPIVSLLPSTAVTPEIQGSTRAPVLRRGGRTARVGVGRVKSAGVMQIHRPLPFCRVV